MAVPTIPQPSDRVPDVLAAGVTDVCVSVLSMSARSPEGRDAEYLEWHGLDHLPEQHRIPQVRSGQRWVSTTACRAVRAASAARYDAVDHVVNYLFAAPVAPAMDAFFALGAALRLAGRMPLRLPPVELGAYDLMARAAAPGAFVGADVLPWRPARGVYLLLEEGACDNEGELAGKALLGVDGVAGIWRSQGRSGDSRFADTASVWLCVLYLDGDPVATGERLGEVLGSRWSDGRITPLLAAPFVTVVPWRWDAALPVGTT